MEAENRIRPENVSVVLNQPQYPENIGGAARAMLNMGFRHLIVVDPRLLDMEKVRKLATHAASTVVEQMTVHDTLSEALAPFQYVVGTTARLGGQRQVMSPDVLARNLIPVSRENRVALVFGREDRGLSNEDLRLCHVLVNIPTAEFSSLNVAQAVLLICYELFKTELREKKPFVPRLANRHELDGMYEQLRDVLIRICYLNPENPDYWMHHIRNLFTRLQFRAREVSIIRGLIRQVNWYGEKRYRDGLEDAEKGGTEKGEKKTCD